MPQAQSIPAIQKPNLCKIEWICLNSHGRVHRFKAPRQYGPDGTAETACPICGAEAMPVDEGELWLSNP